MRWEIAPEGREAARNLSTSTCDCRKTAKRMTGAMTPRAIRVGRSRSRRLRGGGDPSGAGRSEAHVADEGGQLDEGHQQSADGDARGGGPYAPQGVQRQHRRDDADVVRDVDRGGRQEGAVGPQRGAEVAGDAEGEHGQGRQPGALDGQRGIGQPGGQD
ncbi:hypothetical protein SF23_16855, partial [Streptomyces sp. MBRL 10]